MHAPSPSPSPVASIRSAVWTHLLVRTRTHNHRLGVHARISIDLDTEHDLDDISILQFRDGAIARQRRVVRHRVVDADARRERETFWGLGGFLAVVNTSERLGDQLVTFLAQAQGRFTLDDGRDQLLDDLAEEGSGGGVFGEAAESKRSEAERVDGDRMARQVRRSMQSARCSVEGMHRHEMALPTQCLIPLSNVSASSSLRAENVEQETSKDNESDERNESDNLHQRRKNKRPASSTTRPE